MNVKDFEKIVTEFIEEQKDALIAEKAEASIIDLQEALNSADAIAFTIKMNQLYKDKGITDDNGEPLTISHPRDLAIKLSPDGLSGSFDLTPEEDRWLRANQLYGEDILGKLGFKYTNN